MFIQAYKHKRDCSTFLLKVEYLAAAENKGGGVASAYEESADLASRAAIGPEHD